MVAVLLASPGVAAGRRDVAVRGGADPAVGPGRRDAQRLDARDGRGVVHRLAVGGDVAEVMPGAFALEAGPLVAYVAEAGGVCRGCRVEGELGPGGALLGAR